MQHPFALGLLLATLCACGGGGGDSNSGGGNHSGNGGTPIVDNYPTSGNPEGQCSIPAEAGLEDVSSPTTVIGDGTPASCTSTAVVAAIAKGGIITFNCGPDPVVIPMQETARIYNNTGPNIVIDGGGKVMLDGGGNKRILYMNTCDPDLVWTTSHCQDQDHPRLTIQNISFINGYNGDSEGATASGGGAIWARGGRLKVVNSRFFNNRCASTGPDLGGAAIRAFDQSQGLPLWVVNSTFGGRSDLGNSCSNGGALSSIGVSYHILNSLFSYNAAIGYGANPPKADTPGGGSGGAIYNDGNTFHLKVCGTRIENNSAREGGGAIFFVSNDRSGTLNLTDSFLSNNPSQGFQTHPGIFYLGQGNPSFINSTVE